MHGFFASFTSKLRYMYARAGAVSLYTKISDGICGDIYFRGVKYIRNVLGANPPFFKG